MKPLREERPEAGYRCVTNPERSSTCLSFILSLMPEANSSPCAIHQPLQQSAPVPTTGLSHEKPSELSLRTAGLLPGACQRLLRAMRTEHKLTRRATSPSGAWPRVPGLTSLHRDHASLCCSLCCCTHGACVYVLFLT